MRVSSTLAFVALCHAVLCESAQEKTASSNSSDLHNDFHQPDKQTELVIHAEFVLVSLLEVSELRSEIVFSCFLNASWAADQPRRDQDLFKPRLILTSAYRVDNAGFLTSVTTVHRRGDHYHQVALVTVAQRCDFDFGLFPFDTQTCVIRISPVERDVTLVNSGNSSVVQVEPDFNSFQHEFTPHLQLVPAQGVATAAAAGAGQPRAALAVRLRLRRRLWPQVVRLYVPSTLLVSASWLAALIPAPLIRSRLPVTILSLLTLLLACGTARQNGQFSSGPGTAAHRWETGCLLFSLVSVLEAVLDMHLLVRAVTRGDPGSERIERRGARLYFWLYALCWAVYCLVYWQTYVPHWQNSLEDGE